MLKASICSKKYTYLWRKSFTCTLMMPLLCIQLNTVTYRYYHLPVYNMVCSCMKKMFSSFLVLCKRQFTCNRCHKIVQHHTCIMFILQCHVCKHLLHTYRKWKFWQNSWSNIQNTEAFIVQYKHNKSQNLQREMRLVFPDVLSWQNFHICAVEW